MTGPTGSFLLLIMGIGAIFLELRCPRLFLAGSLGLGALVTGGFFLYQRSPQPIAVTLLGLAALLFVAEMIVDTSYVAGIGGTFALGAGCCMLFSGPSRISPALALSLSTGVGCDGYAYGSEHQACSL